MLRITILFQKSLMGTGTGHLKVTCPSCKFTYIKNLFFADLYGRYPIKCEMCNADFAPLYHLLNKPEIKVLWHRNNGKIKPRPNTDTWNPETEIIVEGEEETEDEWFLAP